MWCRRLPVDSQEGNAEKQIEMTCTLIFSLERCFCWSVCSSRTIFLSLACTSHTLSRVSTRQWMNSRTPSSFSSSLSTPTPTMKNSDAYWSLEESQFDNFAEHIEDWHGDNLCQDNIPTTRNYLMQMPHVL